MDSRPKDISPDVMEHLKSLKARPGMYIGSLSLTKLWHFINGMIFYSHVFDKESGRVIIPDGFNEFVEKHYNDHRTFNSFHFVS